MKLRLFLRQLWKYMAWGEGGDTREVYSYLRCSNSIQRILFFCYCRGQQKPVWSCLIDKPRRLDKQRKQTETANSEGQSMGGGGAQTGNKCGTLMSNTTPIKRQIIPKSTRRCVDKQHSVRLYYICMDIYIWKSSIIYNQVIDRRATRGIAVYRVISCAIDGVSQTPSLIRPPLQARFVSHPTPFMAHLLTH